MSRSRLIARFLLALPLWLALGCARTPAEPATRPHAPDHPHAAAATPGADDPLTRVAAIHGGAGPFAVAGYRMGEHARARLGLARGSFDLEVRHETPAQVQWSCIADGLQAATGTSPGKLNLEVVEVAASRPVSEVRDRRTGRRVRLVLREEFVARYLDLPRERLGAAGAEVLRLPDDAIFAAEMSAGTATPGQP